MTLRLSKLIKKIREDLSLLETILTLEEYEQSSPFSLEELTGIKFTDRPSKKYGLTTDKVSVLSADIEKAYKTLDLFLQKPKTYKFDKQKFINSIYPRYPSVRINLKLDPFND